MAVITRAYSETDGNIAYASSINKVIDDLYTLQNGSIGTSNLANSGVLNSSIADSAIAKRNITVSAIYDGMVGTTANIAFSKLNVGGMPDNGLWVTQRLLLEGY